MIGVLYGSHSYNSEAPRVVTKPGHALWVGTSAPGGVSVVISTAMSLAVAVGLVWYMHSKAGVDLLS